MPTINPFERLALWAIHFKEGRQRAREANASNEQDEPINRRWAR